MINCMSLVNNQIILSKINSSELFCVYEKDVLVPKLLIKHSFNYKSEEFDLSIPKVIFTSLNEMANYHYKQLFPNGEYEMNGLTHCRTVLNDLSDISIEDSESEELYMGGFSNYAKQLSQI